MADITDQDRRDARQWAEAIGRSDAPCAADLWHAASRVILATVEVPAPALADELRHITEHWEEWTTETITEELYAATTRAEKMERELDDTRTEVERLTAQNTWPKTTPSGHTYDAPTTYKKLLHQCANAAQAASECWDDAECPPEPTWEMVGIAAAEVDRLTAVNENLRKTDNYREFRDKFLTVQKGAESSAETPDPADVPAGEAWIVECRGERRAAVKDRDDNNVPWNTVNADGWCLPEDNEDITLVSRLVPAPRVITNPDELDTLAEETIIRSKDGDACRKTDVGDWSVDGLDGSVGYGPRQVLPATVLWEPEA